MAGAIALIVLTSAALTGKSPKEVAGDNNRFAFNLYEQLRNENDGNLFFSPFSISTAFAMCYAGADGKTADEIERVLAFGPNDLQFHDGYGRYLQAIAQPDSAAVELNVANRLWGDHLFEASASYLAMTRSAYGAPLQLVDFQNAHEAARSKINAWVSDQTKNRINDLLPQGSVDPTTRMVLTNAIFFKADWLHAFDQERTRERDFHAHTGQLQKVDFMHRHAHMVYHETPNSKMVRLPYKGEKHSMVIVLPKKRGGLSEVEADLNAAAIAPLFTRSFGPEVNLALPKFTMTQPLLLSETLKAMGLKDPFEMSANFSKMSENEGLAISEVIHKAFIEVDEQGTEAAAATAIVMMTTSSATFEPRDIKQFTADHPFVFMVVDDATQSVLFMGRVTTFES